MSAGGRPQRYFVDATDSRWSGKVGLLADDCDLNEDEREERDGDDRNDPQALARERPRGELRDSLERSVIERWLRSFL